MDNTPEIDADHWVRTRNLTIGILILWAVFAFGVHFFAQWLNQFTFISFPLGYYMAVQGSLIAFVALIFIQNAAQDEIDDTHGQDDG